MGAVLNAALDIVYIDFSRDVCFHFLGHMPEYGIDTRLFLFLIIACDFGAFLNMWLYIST